VLQFSTRIGPSIFSSARTQPQPGTQQAVLVVFVSHSGSHPTMPPCQAPVQSALVSALFHQRYISATYQWLWVSGLTTKLTHPKVTWLSRHSPLLTLTSGISIQLPRGSHVPESKRTWGNTTPFRMARARGGQTILRALRLATEDTYKSAPPPLGHTAGSRNMSDWSHRSRLSTHKSLVGKLESKIHIGNLCLYETLQCNELDVKDYNSSCLPLSKTQILPSLYQFC
jgi:hypothetical protein